MLVKIEFFSAFIQTGEAKRDVYVIPPRESSEKCYYWLLLTADYGLVNFNEKYQAQIDTFLTSLGFLQLIYVPQLFHIMDDGGNNQLLAVNIVDDILLVGDQKYVSSVIGKIQ